MISGVSTCLHFIFCHSQSIFCFFGNNIFVQFDISCLYGISGAVAHTNLVGSVFQYILFIVFIVACHLIGVKGKRYFFGFTCFYFDFLVCCQFLIRLVQAAFRCGEINFYNFFTGNFSCIFNFCYYADIFCICFYCFYFNVKIRIGFAVTEFISYFLSKGIEETVAYIDIIVVNFFCGCCSICCIAFFFCFSVFMYGVIPGECCR